MLGAHAPREGGGGEEEEGGSDYLMTGAHQNAVRETYNGTGKTGNGLPANSCMNNEKVSGS